MLKRITLARIDWKKLLLFTGIGYACIIAYYGLFVIIRQYAISSSLLIICIGLQFLLLGGYSLFIVIGCFGKTYLMTVYTKTYPQAWFFVTGTVFITAILAVFQTFWPFFSYTITLLLVSVFSHLFPTAAFFGDAAPLLDVNGFAVSIGAPCSGIESLFLFVAFSLGIYAFDHRRLRKVPFLVVSLIGVVGIYFVNVLRIFLLILTGIYVSPAFAVGMFHTNVGWLLFVIYFLCYYWIIRKFIYSGDSPRKRT